MQRGSGWEAQGRGTHGRRHEAQTVAPEAAQWVQEVGEAVKLGVPEGEHGRQAGAQQGEGRQAHVDDLGERRWSLKI